MQLFYVHNPVKGWGKKEITLTSEESKHAIKVLRKKEGDILYFTDGKGNLFISEIILANGKRTSVRIIETDPKPKQHNYYLHIAIAPTKNMDRFEWFLEKATEIGIDEITPIICSHSERKAIKTNRCNRILFSAMKQSLKFHLPELNEATSFNDFIKQDFNSSKYIAHCKREKKIDLRKEEIEKRTLILIGPEGGFSTDEIEIALQNQFKAVSLGRSRLRTETAGILSAHTINLKN